LLKQLFILLLILFNSRIEEYWDPVLQGLDQIVVTRRVPAVHILLTLDEIDPKTSGYQTTNVPTKFWPPVQKTKEDPDYVGRQRNKKNNDKFRGSGSWKNKESGAGPSRNKREISKKSAGKMDVS
jgi:ribonuclease P/MRP protein subunit RPP25